MYASFYAEEYMHVVIQNSINFMPHMVELDSVPWKNVNILLKNALTKNNLISKPLNPKP